MDTIEHALRYTPAPLAQPTPPFFLKLPAEIRLNIYDYCFFQDVYDGNSRRRDFYKFQQLNPEKFRHFDLLLTNHQIHNEARDIAYAAQRIQLAKSHQTYYLRQVKQEKLFSSPTWKWVIEPDLSWQPSVWSPEALATLRLPKLVLALNAPTDNELQLGEEVFGLKYFDLFSSREALDAFTDFYYKLSRALRYSNATRSLEIHLPNPNAKCTEHFMRWVRFRVNWYEHCDVSFRLRGDPEDVRDIADELLGSCECNEPDDSCSGWEFTQMIDRLWWLRHVREGDDGDRFQLAVDGHLWTRVFANV